MSNPTGKAPAGIDPRFIVDLRGKQYPTWPGVLDLATRSGLRSLTVDLVQAPADENQHTAIMQATATFEDGRLFSDYGDASPRNVARHVQEAVIRMASTRAKGRVLRDACNVGQTMLEELPEVEDEPQPRRDAGRRTPNDGHPKTNGKPPNEDANRVILREKWKRMQHRAGEWQIPVSVFPEEMTNDEAFEDYKQIALKVAREIERLKREAEQQPATVGAEAAECDPFVSDE